MKHVEVCVQITIKPTEASVDADQVASTPAHKFVDTPALELSSEVIGASVPAPPFEKGGSGGNGTYLSIFFI